MKKLVFFVCILFLNSLQAQNLVYIPFKAKVVGRHSSGSYTQNSWLMGNYQMELILGEVYGRAVIGYRFNWSWKEDFKFFGILGGAMDAKGLKQYPDLEQRFFALKPEYVKMKLKLSHSRDLLERAGDYAESIIEVEVFGDQIRLAQPEAHDLKSFQNFVFRSPEWVNITKLANSKVDIQDLRYIGLSKYKGNSGLDDFRAINAELIYSYYLDAKVQSVVNTEIRWPDKEFQQIFREYSRREYKKFSKKINEFSRQQLEEELNADANHQLFWNSVNINLDDYETKESSQATRLKSIEQKAQDKFNRENGIFDLMAKRSGYSKGASELGSRIVRSFSGEKLNSLVSTNIKESTLKHDVPLSGKVNASLDKLSRVNVYMNDVLKFRARRESSRFNTVLIYNYGWNEVKVGLKYKDGMELIERFFTLREGEIVPLRATLVWDFDDDEYKKSDVDLAISENRGCYDGNLLAYHEKPEVTKDSSRYHLDVDNKQGFGPENISVYDSQGSTHYKFCIQNYTDKVRAKAKVVIFKNESIIPISSDDYVFEYEFDSGRKRKWVEVPGTYQSPRN